MSLFFELKKELTHALPTSENWWTKSGWSELRADKAIVEKLTGAVRRTKMFATGQDYKKNQKGEKALLLRTVTELSEHRVKRIKESRYLEEFLERYIAASCRDIGIRNQYNILSGILKNQTRKAIDLVRINGEDELCELIELKASNNVVDNPLSAAFEIILDYFILEAIREDVARIEKLTILAPRRYYDYFGEPEDGFAAIVNALSGSIGRKLDFQALGTELDEEALSVDLKPGELQKDNRVLEWFKGRTSVRP